MKLNFIKINPTENMTIYILDKVDRKLHAQVANKIMDYNSLNAEQVGFLEECDDKNSGAVARLQMMGGEFCGNASRGFAAMLFDQKIYTQGKEILIETSGSSQILKCNVEPLSDKAYEVSMGLPDIIWADKFEIAKDNKKMQGVMVNFGGICHAVFVVDKINRSEKYIKEILELLPYKEHEAFGVLQYEKQESNMLPAVFVKQTKTLFVERSCGSGTAAVGVAMAILQQKTQSLVVKQDGGELKIFTQYIDGMVKNITLGGIISMVAKGEVYI